MAYISFTFVSTEVLPARYGFEFKSGWYTPSAASSRYPSPDFMAAASSPRRMSFPSMRGASGKYRHRPARYCF